MNAEDSLDSDVTTRTLTAPVARFFRTFLIFLACFQLGVGVDALMQVVAWSRMMVDYSNEEGLAKGVSMTFDGQHPCCLCKVVARSREEEEKRQPQDVTRVEMAFRSFVPPGNRIAMEPRWTDVCTVKFIFLPDGISIPGGPPPLPPPQMTHA